MLAFHIVVLTSRRCMHNCREPDSGIKLAANLSSKRLLFNRVIHEKEVLRCIPLALCSSLRMCGRTCCRVALSSEYNQSSSRKYRRIALHVYLLTLPHPRAG